ncbi:MAG: Uma2 family endonuclease [Segetibacter sp.]|nr:Uma2 family endonuclease [Segetibacter sp.]
MKVAEDIRYTFEGYLKLEEAGEVKHEFYYGKLFEMPGAPVLHNNICLKLFLSLYNRLNAYGYQLNVENVKVKVENEEIYLYPDVLVTKESFQTMKDYIVHQPALIAEVVSDNTRKYDSTDKFIQYQKISSLQYYLLVEPEKHLVIFYEKDESGNWSSKTLTEMNEVIELPFFLTQISLTDIYS